MKKFYIPTLLAVFFLSSFYSQGQTYTSITSNPTNLTFDDPNFWLGHVAPPTPCTGCTITIQTNVSMVQSGSSTANPNNTIFTGQTPTAAPVSIGQGVTLGSKFQSDVNGFVNGVRFYKAAPMGNSHIGLLYQLSPTITLLGQVNFTNESASGWQDAKFTSPIPINANVNYMIAYFVPAADGFFEIDNNYFTSPVTNGHLTSPQNSATFGANGQYETGNSPTFPDLDPFVVSGGTFSAVNQWVDVDFNPVNLNDVVFNNSTIKIIGPSTVVSINSYVQLFGSSIVVANNPTDPVTLLVNDQVDIDATSLVQIGNPLSYIDANNGISNPVIGPHADFANLGGPNLAGIYSILTAPVGGFNYSYTLNSEGIGYATGGSSFIQQYNINCPGPSPAGCVPGIVNGASITGTDATLGVIFGSTITLPVQLVQFLANKNDDGSVKVIWSTSQEENSDFYDVERSSDQTGWASIGTVKAKGFSSTTSNYFLTDKSPLSGIGYYRLKMVDLDGKFKYSPTVAVTTDNNTLPLVIYSNPFFDQIRLKINLSRPQNLMMTVSDMQGKTYITQSYQAQSGDNFVNIQPSVTASGMYILKIQGDTFNQTVKLEKQ
ncbi:MAG TPA: DUF4082 domain-containing protein [Puia sp.]|nr:DUF4082 domain-containing protein [Puia sp.]